MILTVTLNPAIDKTYTTDTLLLGQINRVRTVQNIPGGKGINVTKLLRQHGYEVMACGFLGGYAGEFIENSMEQLQVQCRFTRTAGETRSSINVIADDGYVTELLEPGPVISGQELEQFLADYKEAVKRCDLIVLSGSVANCVPADIYSELIHMGKAEGKRCILDTSGEALVRGAEAAPYMIKPNQKELEYLIGHKLKDIDEIAKAAAGLQRRGIERVVVSLGKRGLLTVADQKVLWAKAPQVKAVNTVGCGDSVVASWVMSLLKGEDVCLALRQAAAMSAANAATLESGKVSRKLTEELLENVGIEIYGYNAK